MKTLKTTSWRAMLGVSLSSPVSLSEGGRHTNCSVSSIMPPPRPEIRDARPVFSCNQGKSRLIKPNDEIFKHHLPSANGAAPYQPRATPGFATHMTPALKGRPNPLIKAKNPTIVHNQGSSRQTMKFSNGEVGRVTPCAPSRRTQTLSLAGGGVQRTARPASHSPFASLRLRVFALNPRYQVTINPQSRQKPL